MTNILNKSDAARTNISLRQTEGKRVTYKELTKTINELQARKKIKMRVAQLKRLGAYILGKNDA